MDYKKSILILLSFISLGVGAAIPSVEGLFRNGHNADPSGELIVLKVQVSETKELDEIPMEETTEEELKANIQEEKTKVSYYKFIFRYEGDQRLQLIQVGYKDGKMGKDSIFSVEYRRRASEIQKSFVSTETNLFYSLLTLLSLNYRYYMKDLLVSSNQDFQENKLILNKEKIKVYESYKNYLKMTKEDEALKETMANPLKPEDLEERAKVKEVLNQNMFVRQEQVKLVKKSDRFFWNIQLENLEANFENDTHRLVDMVLRTPLGEVSVLADDYILFDGIHELPKRLIIKTANKKSYDLRFLSTQHYTQNKKSKRMRDRHKDYLKYFAELKKEKKPLAEGEEPYVPAGVGLFFGI